MKQEKALPFVPVSSKARVDVPAVQARESGQYTLGQILGIWAVGTLPAVLFTWVVAPAIIPYSPLLPGITYWLLMIAAMAWQGVVALVIVYRELGTLRWSALRQRMWLQTPLDPKTDEPNPRLWWWLVPPLLWNAVFGLLLGKYLDQVMTWLLPGLQPLAFTQMSQLANADFTGQWWLLGVALASIIFNYLLGEAFLWHGVLLPKMQGVFGRYDWIANAVIFGLYHLHKPWELPSVIATNLGYSWPARRFRSNWMAVIIHAVEGVPTLIVIPAMILGASGG